MDEKKEVTLYDPHPGFLGAAVPLPAKMKKAIDGLEGKTMPLEEVVQKLEPIAKELNGQIEVDDKFKASDNSYCILFSFTETGGRKHMYRLIRCKDF